MNSLSRKSWTFNTRSHLSFYIYWKLEFSQNLSKLQKRVNGENFFVVTVPLLCIKMF